MKDLLELQKKIVPEISEILEKRFMVLRNVFYNQPIGRRALANNLNIGERIIRTEVNLLKDQGLIEIKSIGMNVTNDGKEVIKELKDFIHSLKGLSGLEKKIQEKLKIKRVIIVPGSYDEDSLILKDIGKTASLHIKSILKDNSIIGITGGSTMAQVAEEMTYEKLKKNILVLPARGGLGKNLETQSNNVAAVLAKKLGGSYKLLHVPDNVDKDTLKTIFKIPEIKELREKIKEIDILVFGIGRAEDMANRRKVSKETMDNLLNKKAVAEAFGYYFNTKCEKILESSTVGLSLEDFKNVKNVIGVACGDKKGEAIVSISSLKKDMTLIIDESAAKKIMDIIK